MSNNTPMKTEEQIKAEIAEQVKQNITKFNSENPRLCKKNKKIYQKLKEISPDEIVLFHLPSVLKVKDLEFELLRSYNYVDREGYIKSSEYTNKPMTFTTSMLGITKPIFIIRLPEKHLKRDEYFCNHLIHGAYCIHNDFTDDGLYEDIKEAFEKAYRYHNQARLTIDPEKTNRIICSKWNILGTEPVTLECPQTLITWEVDPSTRIILGKYDNSEDEIMLYNTRGWLIGASYSTSNSPFNWHGKELRFKFLGK